MAVIGGIESRDRKGGRGCGRERRDGRLSQRKRRNHKSKWDESEINNHWDGA